MDNQIVAPSHQATSKAISPKSGSKPGTTKFNVEGLALTRKISFLSSQSNLLPSKTDSTKLIIPLPKMAASKQKPRLKSAFNPV